MAVIDNTFETKGTHLFFIDDISNTDGVVTKLTCPTGITGLNAGPKDKIPTDCLDDESPFHQYIGGKATPTELAIPFILYKGDGSHQTLFELFKSGKVIGWYCGLSDASSAPTIADTDGLTLTSPTDRTGFSFTGYVSNLAIDVAQNEIVRGLLNINPRSAFIPHWAA